MFDERRVVDKPIAVGMIGGGAGSQIGYAHRNALMRDHCFELKAAALDLDPERGRKFAMELGVSSERCYADYRELIEKEVARGDDGIKVLLIATPNHTHFEICKLALAAGLHIVCEKPVTASLEQALELKRLHTNAAQQFMVMYGYGGYSMVEQARTVIARGDLGEIRHVDMQFAHGYHATEVEAHDAGYRWRMRHQAGSSPSYVIADIGTHCFALAQHMIGQMPIKRLTCLAKAHIKDRYPLEDDARILLEYESGAIGHLWASSINIGSAHGFRVKIIGEKASLAWWDEQPNQLQYSGLDNIVCTWEKGMGNLVPSAQNHRIGSGHPEGFFDSWANLYKNFALCVIASQRGEELPDAYYPNLDEGIEGVRLIEMAMKSALDQSVWVDYKF